MNEIIAGVVVAAVYVAGYMVLFGRLLRRPEKVRYDEYAREPPADLPPVLVATLFGTYERGELAAATLLDLIGRGVIALQDAGSRPVGYEVAPAVEDHLLRLDRSRCPYLRPIEWHLVWLLFDVAARGADEVRVHQLRGWLESEGSAQDGYRAWWRAAQQAAVGEGYLQPRFRHVRAWAAAYGYGGMLLTVPAAIAGAGVGCVVLFFAAIALLLWSGRLVPVTDRGVFLRGQYRRFRNHMLATWDTRQSRAEDVALNAYLPLALVMGLAPRAFRDLYITPPEFNGRGTPHAQWGHGGPKHDRSLAQHRWGRTMGPTGTSLKQWWVDLHGSPW
jgi:hypothetical protein